MGLLRLILYHQYETQEDGSQALVLPGDMSLRMGLGPEQNLFHWMTEKDGKIHGYTLTMALKVDTLPSSEPLLLFHGRGIGASSEARPGPAGEAGNSEGTGKEGQQAG